MNGLLVSTSFWMFVTAMLAVFCGLIAWWHIDGREKQVMKVVSIVSTIAFAALITAGHYHSAGSKAAAAVIVVIAGIFLAVFLPECVRYHRRDPEVPDSRPVRH